MGNGVSTKQCEEMRELREQDISMEDIASEFGYSASTVVTHVNDECNHQEREWGRTVVDHIGDECPFCGEEVAFLPKHLPCENESE